MNKMIRYISIALLLLLSQLSHITNAEEKVRFNSSVDAQISQQEASKVPGSPWLSTRLLVPHLIVMDVVESKKFYAEAFGFKVRFEDKKGAESQHVEMSYYDELALMFVPKNVRGTGILPPVEFVDSNQLTAYFYLYVESVDEVYDRAINAGALSITEPYDSAWGGRFAIIADPNGYHWGLAESKNMQFE